MKRTILLVLRPDCVLVIAAGFLRVRPQEQAPVARPVTPPPPSPPQAPASTVDRDEALYEALLAAAQNGSLAKVRRLLHSGANPNACDDGKAYISCYRENPLGAAASRGYDGIVLALIASGARSNDLGPHPDPQPPIYLAVAARHPSTVRVLLAHGAVPSTGYTMNVSRSAMAAAVANNDLPTVRCLLEHGSDPNDDYAESVPMLSNAKKLHNTAMLRLLRAHFAKASSR